MMRPSVTRCRVTVLRPLNSSRQVQTQTSPQPKFNIVDTQDWDTSKAVKRASDYQRGTDAELRKKVEQWKLPYSRPPTSNPKALLTEEEYDHYYEHGYVIKHNIISPELLKPVIRSIEDMTEELAQSLYRAGLIKDTCAKGGFYDRVTMLEKQFPHVSVLFHKRGILPTSFANLWSSEPLLRIAEQFLGPEIAGHPVWNLRVKTPQQEQATVPWHQDTAYLASECWSTHQVTAWVPLLNANKENGCMELARGGHRSGKTATHVACAGNTWYVDLPRREMEKTLGIDMKKDLVVCEVPMGSVLLLNNIIPHRSLNNFSNQIRWSLDLRWHRPSDPNGFHGLKHSILMKTRDPNFKIDWEAWSKINRSTLQDQAMNKAPTTDDLNDTTIGGPWMDTWDMVNQNRHTSSYKAGSTSWHKS